jgi:ribosomal subunit interface protein
MQVTVTGRHLDVGDALRTHVETGLDTAVGKYFDRAIDSAVTFTKTGTFFHVDVAVHVGRGITVRGEAEANDPYVAFNGASEHIAKRLRRHKRRLRDHHNDQVRAVETMQADQYILSQSDYDDAPDAGPNYGLIGGANDGQDNDAAAKDAEPVVVAEMQTEISTLTVEEAVMRMDLENVPAVMFRNISHGGLNMLYRRPDGNIGWVDPRGNREKTV